METEKLANGAEWRVRKQIERDVYWESHKFSVLLGLNIPRLMLGAWQFLTRCLSAQPWALSPTVRRKTSELLFGVSEKREISFLSRFRPVSAVAARKLFLANSLPKFQKEALLKHEARMVARTAARTSTRLLVGKQKRSE